MSNTNETYIDLKDIVRAIVKKFYIVIIITGISAAAGWYYGKSTVYSYYETKTTLIVGNPIKENGSSYNIKLLATYEKYLSTYVTLLTKDKILESTIAKSKLNTTADVLRASISAVPQPNTQFIDVYFRWNDFNQTRDIFSTLILDFTRQARTLYPDVEINIFDHMKMPQKIIAGSVRKYVILGVVGGIVSSILLIFAIDFMHDTFADK